MLGQGRVMFEKRLAAVPAQSFIANGTADGKISVADASLFKVKQKVNISALTLDNLNLEVKAIIDINTMYVGPVGGAITTRTNLTLYTLALSASIDAIEQPRPGVPEQEIERHTYEEEPVVARRVILVDKLGNKIDNSNPLPVSVDTTVNIGDVRITAADNDPNPGNVHSSVRISDGVDELEVNNDGSINVNVVTSASSAPGLEIAYQEVSAVAAGIETTLITLTAPLLGYKLYRAEVSGENIALYRLKVNGVTKATKRTFFGGDLNEAFVYEPFENGLELASGDVLTLTVLHQRPSLSNFEATLKGLNL
jgi:hypothetical protein